MISKRQIFNGQASEIKRRRKNGGGLKKRNNTSNNNSKNNNSNNNSNNGNNNGDEREEDTGVKNLKARNLHIALDSARKDRTKVTIEEGKTEQLIKEQHDRDDFASGFSKLRDMKTPIYHEDIHSPYVYSDFVYSTNKVKDGVLHGEFTIAQPQKDGAIKWWTEKYECIGETIPPSPDNPNHVSQVAKPKAPKRDFKHDRSEVDKLGDPQQLTYAHIEKIRDCKQRILKKYDDEWRKNRQSEIDSAWQESGIDFVKSQRLKDSFKATFDAYMHDPRNPKPKKDAEKSTSSSKSATSKTGQRSSPSKASSTKASSAKTSSAKTNPSKKSKSGKPKKNGETKKADEPPKEDGEEGAENENRDESKQQQDEEAKNQNKAVDNQMEDVKVEDATTMAAAAADGSATEALPKRNR